MRMRHYEHKYKYPSHAFSKCTDFGFVLSWLATNLIEFQKLLLSKLKLKELENMSSQSPIWRAGHDNARKGSRKF